MRTDGIATEIGKPPTIAWPTQRESRSGRVREMHMTMLATLSKDAQNPTLKPWVRRSEWLVPRIERFRCRHHRARQRPQDPDLPLPETDDEAAAR